MFGFTWIFEVNW